MRWVRDNLKIVAPIALVGAVVVGYLAFGVFGIHTLFIDDKVNEDVPVFASGANASGLASDAVDDATTDAMNEVMADEGIDAAATVAEPMPDMAAAEIVTVYEGMFGPRSHPGRGLAKVLNDGSTQRFLRFEDFETDNGPDLNVYLTTADADADADDFGASGEFHDLGDLKGNIGPQNYEIPADVDLAEFDTVVIWCVRFGVAFAAADLAPVG
ncbi:MAG: DM13 domain-containing protein [Ilumatobacter sp.]|nr:DM13 domain-containing protein [Ilumatobacter sp.]